MRYLLLTACAVLFTFSAAYKPQAQSVCVPGICTQYSNAVVYGGQVHVQPAGQGTVPTVLTLQDKNDDGVESGEVFRAQKNNGTAVDEVFSAVNGEAKPGNANSGTYPFSTLSFSAMNLPSAASLGIYLDIIENDPGGNNLTIGGIGTLRPQDLVLLAFKDDGTLIGEFYFTGEFHRMYEFAGGCSGGGCADQVFNLSASGAFALDALYVANPDLRLGLRSILSDVDRDGPDQYFFGPFTAIPEPSTMLLVSISILGVGAGALRRRCKNESADVPNPE